MGAFLLEGVKFRFASELVLDVDRLEVPSGAVTLLTGANGSGKTTLLRVMAGLLAPEAGAVAYRGAPVLFGKRGLAHRRRVTLLSQEPYLFQGTVLRNVAYGPRARGMDASRAHEAARAALLRTRCERLAGRDAAKLSGGEKKRVALARALAAGAETLLLDEPASYVDAENSALILAMIEDLAAAGLTLVVSAHTQGWAGSLPVRSVRLAYGRVAGA